MQNTYKSNVIRTNLTSLLTFPYHGNEKYFLSQQVVFCYRELIILVQKILRLKQIERENKVWKISMKTMKTGTGGLSISLRLRP